MKRTSLLVAAVLALAPLVHAQQTPPTPAQIAAHLVQRYAILLGLSSTVQEQAVTIYTTEETSLSTIRATERTDRAALLTAVEAGNTANITQLSNSLGELSGQATLAQATANAAFFALLTSDQQTRFSQILSSGPGMGGPGSSMGSSSGGMGGPGGPPQH